MSGNQAILREYLISLGFKTDEVQQKKFDKSLLKTDFTAKGLFKTVLGVGAAAATMTTLFARSMEQLYYSTRKAESGAGNLQAFEYAAKQIGLSGGVMTTAIEGMARSIRQNPGLQGLIESFGIQVTGRDKADVAIDLIEALGKMPFYVGSQYANMFGIGPDEYLLLTESVGKFREAVELRKQMAKATGVDADAAAKAGVAYSNMLKNITEKVMLLKDSLAIALLPTMQNLASVTTQVLDDWIKIINRFSGGKEGGVTGFFKNLYEGARLALGFGLSGDRATPTSRAFVGTVSSTAPAAPAAPAASSGGTTAQKFARLEAQYGLPAGLLDRMWAKESNRGKNMLSPVGAKGHFQFMDPTAKQYGVDVNDLDSSANGAARMMADLLKWSGGDIQKALAGYNWGMGKVNKFGMAKMPAETRDYVQTLSGQPIVLQQQTTIEVNGSNASDVATRVASVQDRVNGDAVRNLAGAVR